MREKLSFNENWYFHKGDIENKTPDYKSYMYMSSKTERMQTGPACRKYTLTIDDWVGKTEYNDEVWKKVNLPHDFVIEEKPLQDCIRNTKRESVRQTHLILMTLFFLP